MVGSQCCGLSDYQPSDYRPDSTEPSDYRPDSKMFERGQIQVWHCARRWRSCLVALMVLGFGRLASLACSLKLARNPQTPMAAVCHWATSALARPHCHFGESRCRANGRAGPVDVTVACQRGDGATVHKGHSMHSADQVKSQKDRFGNVADYEPQSESSGIETRHTVFCMPVCRIVRPSADSAA